ncbi:MAG: N-acetyl-gamma-glutamyl-phosphate reductase [Acidimicrobiia bacterium]
MAYQAAVVGGSGYTGAELLRLLAGHPDLDVVHVTADSNAGATVASLYPSLAAAYPGLTYGPMDPAAVAGLDVVFLAMPHGASQSFAPAVVDEVAHVVDLGADFRLPADAYAQWYGDPHTAPELIDRFGYGLVELYRDELVAHRHAAVPGCYPTAASLALAPLVAHGLVAPEVVVDAMSGVSGAGRGLKVSSHFSEADESVSAYGLLTHRHTAEIEQTLTKVGGAPVTALFTPHLVPMVRGMHATCHAVPAVEGLSTAGLLDIYREFYAGEPFVVVTDEPPPTKAATGANTCHVTVRFDPRTGRVLALGVLDNLTKGASGGAVQNANLLLGLPEATGLPTVGMWP